MSNQTRPDTFQNIPGSGVQALIDRLRGEGVAAGKAEGDAILAEARTRATELIASAEQEAKEILEAAHSAAAREQAAGHDNLKIAARDMVLTLRNELGQQIQEEAKRLVGVKMTDEAFLQKLILTMAGQAKSSAGITQHDSMEVVLPDRILSFEELKQSPEAVEPGTLTHFVLCLASKLLQEGVTFASAPGVSGIKVKLTGKDVVIDLSETAVAGLLARHLQPRLRAIMEGVGR